MPLSPSPAPLTADDKEVAGVIIPGLDFVAIDFETANAKRASVCQIGIAKIRNGIVTNTATEYVLPPEGFQNFGHWNIKIHGITRRMVDGAPTWEQLLPRLTKYVKDLPLVGHNVSVEKSVILQASAAIDVEAPEFDYLCSQKLAQHHLPDAPSYKLNNLVEHLDLPGFAHHDAGEDAVASANLVIAIAASTGLHTLGELWPPQKTYSRPYVRRAS
ncbi:3'-5' exonuclease [Arthrobacter sp. H14]|uniref:3'-5' exonuclease n=1 Tax=Arthrobacter sp. H14 TaxID=1312959 RepID=UPI0006843637|nr:3'-5' exonuclease [Arthrobacter sp. H14]